MKPIGPLMIEHRLIEHMVALVRQEIFRIGETGEIAPAFIESAVDFFRMYADRTHHGKEEDILFKALSRKQLSEEHRGLMNGLIEDHILSRKLVNSLDTGRGRYVQGDPGAVPDVVACLNGIVNLYPAHIEKEDKHFFYPAMEYFGREEQDNMLREFWEFDRRLIHEKYQGVVARLEGQPVWPASR